MTHSGISFHSLTILYPLKIHMSFYYAHVFFRYIQIVRVIKGRGDVFDTSGRIASVKGAALNVAALATSEGTVDLSQENEDLKVDFYSYIRLLF